MKIVLVATAWGSGEGGVNAFNYSLAIALAQVGSRNIEVYCALPSPDEEQVRQAANFGVELISVVADDEKRPMESCGSEVIKWLSERGLGQPDLWIGHDVITGFAALAAARLSGHVALIHHMAYLQYHNATGGRGSRTLEKHEQQRTLFSTERAIVFGVGPSLTTDAMSLGCPAATTLVPGFPAPFTKNLSNSRSLQVIVAGRFDMDSEALKQSRLAVASLAQAVRKAGAYVQPLSQPTMIIFGVSEARVAEAELETLAWRIAGKHINIVPGPFDTTPGRLIEEMTSSNLAIMPSFHEGFGLVGWEAIGCEVPLILGRETGLFKFIDGLLGGQGVGCLKAQSFRGGDLNELDVDALSDAIIDVARSLDRARLDAAKLRSQLQMERGCTWRHTALSLLVEVAKHGVNVPGAVIASDPGNIRASATDKASVQVFDSKACDHFKECAELDVSAGQGSSPKHFDVVAELRFGTTPLKVDDMNVQVFVRQASIRVSSEGGKLQGARFGEGPLKTPGVQSMAGGVWNLTDPEGGDRLKGKVLGDDVLCRIAAPFDVPAGARVEVTASPADIGCDIALPDDQELALTTRKVMEVFLKKAIFKESSGHVVLSEAELQDVSGDA